jgi:CheY-like chemotaxis protein
LEYLAGAEVVTPDIFILDIGLPGMDGITLLGKIRLLSTISKIPAIAFTAHAMSTDRQRFLDAGFNGYISKPIIDEGDLVVEIERLTDSD